MNIKFFPLLLILAVITGCASTDSQRYAALDSPDSAYNPDPILVLLSKEQKAAVTNSFTELVEDPSSIEFFDVYAVAGSEVGGDPLVCGSIKYTDSRGGPARTQPFALSGKRAMLLDEATNWGFIKTGREVLHSYRQRPFVGSWWVQCRPQTFSVLVERREENQRTMEAGR